MPKSLELMTVSVSKTQELAEKIGGSLKEGDIILLTGDLGAGKTSFTIGLAKGLGIKELVSSPTYTIVNEYRGRHPVYHLDLYRLETLEEMEVIGYEEYYYGKGITVVEWGDKISASLPDDYLGVSFKRTVDNENSRHLIFKGSSAKFDGQIQSISNMAKEIGLLIIKDA